LFNFINSPRIHELGENQQNKGIIRLVGDSIKKTIMDNDDIKKVKNINN
jgi:hypothetical protein